MRIYKFLSALGLFLFTSLLGFSSEADLKIPDLHSTTFPHFGGIDGWHLLLFGSFVIVGTLGISLYLFSQIKKMPAHKSMLDVADTIYKTCRTYLLQQGKFLIILFAIIAVAIVYYLVMAHSPESAYSAPVVIVLVLLFSIVGMGGSYAVDWY